jgi:hypothetical protein
MRLDRIQDHHCDCWKGDFRGAGVSPAAFSIFNIEQIAGETPAPQESWLRLE